MTTNIFAFKIWTIHLYLFSVNATVQTEPPDATIFITTVYVDLVCDLDIDSSDGVDISFTWTGPNGIVTDGSGYTITDQPDTTTLRVSPLNISRDHNAEYTCLVTVALGNDTVQGNNSLILHLQRKLKSIFNVFWNSNYAKTIA